MDDLFSENNSEGFPIVIIFGRSTSPIYNSAVNFAKRYADKYTEKIYPTTTKNIASFSFDNFDKAYTLFLKVYNWKSFEAFLNNELIEKGLIERVKRIYDCYSSCKESFTEEDYCLGMSATLPKKRFFQCKRLKSILRDYDWKSSYIFDRDVSNLWYKQGVFENDNTSFHIDKTRILNSLLSEMNAKYTFLCPKFSEELLKKEVDSLPSEIVFSGNNEYFLKNIFSRNTIVSLEEKENLDIEEKSHSISFHIREDKDLPKPETTSVKYSDIGGMNDVIKLLKESVELPFKYPEVFEHLGIVPYNGILFYGPPGTGKTLLAKAVANETNLAFYSINGPEILNKFLGESESNLRKYFNAAEETSPSVIYIDEIDSIASKRGLSASSDVYNKIVAQLLTLMDGMNEREKVIVMASTNKPDHLDEALRRPGRLDYEIYIPPPNEEARFEILKIHTKEMPLDLSVDLHVIAESLHGYVGADIAALCKEAALSALRKFMKTSSISDGNISNITIGTDDFVQAKEIIKPSAGREVLANKPLVKWEDVIGLDDVKKEVRKKVIKPFLHKSVYQNVEKIKGLLFYGPSGVGKTLLAKAIASELNLNIISLKGSDIASIYHGGSEINLKSYFKKAKELSPTIIIIDEIEAIASSRSPLSNSNYHNSLVNELLSQLDGFDRLNNIIVIGTTNHLDYIDESILRPGRFDLLIEIPFPNEKDLRNLLTFYLNKSGFPWNPQILEEKFTFRTGAEVSNAVKQAVYELLWNDNSSLDVSHFIPKRGINSSHRA